MLDFYPTAILNERRKLRWSQEELAKRAGVGRSDIQRIEKGQDVGTKMLGKVLAQLPELASFRFGHVEVVNGGGELRALALDMIATGTRIIELLDRRPGVDATAGATRVAEPVDVSPELKEELRTLDPTDPRNKERSRDA